MTASNLRSIKRAFVTGATGFIGGFLVRDLAAKGWEVHALARQKPTNQETLRACVWHLYDGTYESVEEAIALSRADVVFHLASVFLAEHRPSEIDLLVNANLRLGMQLLEAMHQHRVNGLVNTGTSWQHLKDSAYDPVNLYAATKQAFEAIIDYYCNAHGLAAITLKLYDTYGPHDIRRKLIPYLEKSLRDGTPLDMTEGLQEISLVHVEDIVRAFGISVKLLSSANHLRFGLPARSPLTIREVVEKLTQNMPKEPKVTWGTRQKAKRQPDSPAVIDKLPDWQPLRSFPD